MLHFSYVEVEIFFLRFPHKPRIIDGSAKEVERFRAESSPLALASR